jgi:anaerobic ribonucleoside-triphosphate reductase activating protein
MNYGMIRRNDIANGEGVRVSLFVSGCRNRCKNCFNKETWDFSYGTPFTDETLQQIIKWLAPSYIRGLSILGGEPMEPENQPDVLNLVQSVRRDLPEKDIWLYTGFTLEELTGEKLSRALSGCSIPILRNIDVLIDGRYEDSKRDISLRFRGSSNQRIINMKETIRANEIVLQNNLCE